MLNQPTIPVKSSSVTTFSASNIKTLELNIENALKEGFKSTFLFGESEYADDIANNFARSIAPSLSKAIDDYVKNMILSQNINIIPATLFTQVGPAPVPVTGTMSTFTDIMIN